MSRAFISAVFAPGPVETSVAVPGAAQCCRTEGRDQINPFWGNKEKKSEEKIGRREGKNIYEEG